MTYEQIYKVSRNKSMTVSNRQKKLEGLFNTLILEVRDKPPKNKRESDRYWHRAIEISREIGRVREGIR